MRGVYFGYSSDGLILTMFRRKFVIRRKAISKPIEFDGSKLELFESDYNCGYKNKRMTERAVELSILRHWINDKENIFEVGAVSPYYFPGLIEDICDPADEHEKVNYRQSLFDIDFSDRNVVCISTIEHVGTFEHGLDLVENPAEGLEKLIRESQSLLVTFPCGYNPILDDYLKGGGDIKELKYGRMKC